MSAPAFFGLTSTLADLGEGLRLAGQELPEGVDTRLDPVREVL
jgi:hypothetical protein